MPVEITPDGAMERTPFTTRETLRVRCPHCRKLYLVQFADIQEAKPRFECVQCHTRFWLSLNALTPGEESEVLGLPMQVREPAPMKPAAKPAPNAKKDPCPKCFKPVEAGRTECASCGVIIEKYKNSMSFNDPVPTHSPALAQLWKKLIDDYANDPLHAEFLKACQRERNLAFAATQYAQMQKLMPADETTARRLQEIQALGAVLLPPTSRQVRVPRAYPRLWQFLLMGATLTMVVGMVAPMFRNLVGVGAVLLFIGAALQIHFRARP